MAHAILSEAFFLHHTVQNSYWQQRWELIRKVFPEAQNVVIFLFAKVQQMPRAVVGALKKYICAAESSYTLNMAQNSMKHN